MMAARNKDLENKKGTLKQDMQYLIEQMRKLKTNSDEVEERLYKLLTETLNLLQRNFEEKSGALRNDLSELQRQEAEIQHIE